jgi:hypothetical protein
MISASVLRQQPLRKTQSHAVVDDREGRRSRHQVFPTQNRAFAGRQSKTFRAETPRQKGDHVSGKRGQVEIGVMSSEWHSSPAGVRRSAGNAARRGNPPKDADYCWECRMHMAALWPGIPLTAPPRIADEPAR